jgi:hypothetical protein
VLISLQSSGFLKPIRCCGNVSSESLSSNGSLCGVSMTARFQESCHSMKRARSSVDDTQMDAKENRRVSVSGSILGHIYVLFVAFINS